MARPGAAQHIGFHGPGISVHFPVRIIVHEFHAVEAEKESGFSLSQHVDQMFFPKGGGHGADRRGGRRVFAELHLPADTGLALFRQAEHGRQGQGLDIAVQALFDPHGIGLVRMAAAQGFQAVIGFPRIGDRAAVEKFFRQGVG